LSDEEKRSIPSDFLLINSIGCISRLARLLPSNSHVHPEPERSNVLPGLIRHVKRWALGIPMNWVFLKYRRWIMIERMDLKGKLNLESERTVNSFPN
jgi:hypothetical protein